LLAPTIVVIDTGLANLHQPGALRVTDPEDVYTVGQQGIGNIHQPYANEVWDRDADNVIDPIAGHGTFIAGIIKMIAPMCRLRVQGPLTGYGDISEHDLTIVLQRLYERGAPDLLNLSLGGYAVEDMPALGKVVRDLQRAGTVLVASAGNDATCRPTYPAAFPGVIAVGALGPYGPAHFTNYGNWVRACAPGVNVVSTFFDDCPAPGGGEFDGWATWSGTSFAAPAVVGALAHAMLADRADLDDPEQRREARARAVQRLIDDPGLFRIPGLGAVVNQTPWWRRRA
jgi:subtilisin family serine protease